MSLKSLLKQKAISSIFWNNSKLAFQRNSSTFSKNGREEALVVSEDGRVIVCWHPEPKMPYELTKPIPQVEKSTSALKFNYDYHRKDVFRKTHPYFEIKKLQELTFTTKHIWFPRPERKLIKFKEQQPKDREYL